MESRKFDDITRSLATGTSRRQVLKILGGSIAGGIATLLGNTGGSAQSGCARPGEGCPNGDADCCKGSCCAGICCPPGNVCESGACAPPGRDTSNGSAGCPPGMVRQGPNCLLVNGQPCADAATCVSGFCVEGVCCDSACDDQCYACNSATSPGTCTALNGIGCDDGDACTVGDVCQDGVCTPGSPINCDDGNPCTINSCDPATGCVTDNAAIGIPCSDGTFCNGLEVCDGSGTCVDGTPVECGPCLTCAEAEPHCVGDSTQDDAPCGSGGHVCASGDCVCPGDTHECSEGGPCQECCTHGECPDDRPRCVEGNCVCKGSGQSCNTSTNCCPGNICASDGFCCTASDQPCVTPEQCCSGGCDFDSDRNGSFCG